MDISKDRRNTVTCQCGAYPFPHRLGSGKCEEDKVCSHGCLTPEHPDYTREHYCPECHQYDGPYDTLEEKYL